MNKMHFFIVNICVAMFFVSCEDNYFEVDTQQLQTKIYEPSALKYEGLQSTTVLYLDHSTCVIDARRNSRVFNAMRPQLGQYSDTLRLIRGTTIETIPLNRSDNRVFETLETIKEDIPYSDILKAVEQICLGNQQAILITDCEFIKDGLCHDSDPYLSEPFKDWVREGHCIYIVVEPYQERNNGKLFDKKRFYFIFSDDRMDAPISYNMLNEIQPFLQDSTCKLYKLTNSDIFVQYSKDMVDRNLTFTVEDFPGFEYVDVSDDWKSIRKFVMKLDRYGELLPEEEPVPIIKNLVLHDGEDYFIDDVEIVATNITAQYLALDDNTITPDNVDMSEAFKLDKNALKDHKLNVLFTDKVFHYLTDEYGGNLIRLDFVITKVGLQNNYNAEMFTWQSLYNNEEAICVAKSIDNVLHDVEIAPTSKNRRIIHTVFIKTESYKQ
jgi:hypothetical protein